MKTRANLTIVVLLISLLFAGCWSNSPEDVAKDFADALSSANINEAKELATERTQKKIDNLVKVCNKPYFEELANETIKAYKMLNNSGNNSKLSKKLKKRFSEMEEELKKLMQEYQNKYGNIRRLPYEKRKEILNEISKKLANKIIKPMIDDAFDDLDIEVEHPKEVKAVLVKFFLEEATGQGERYMSLKSRFYNIIKNENFGSVENVTPECVAKHTDFGFIDDINIIEVKTKSPDKAIVRLELIDKNDKSTKVAVPVEKIKDEWKVSNLHLNNIFSLF